jgi:glyoxylase-like metal-dependent hydrolase (beta-lactamase superfamily II)
LTALAYSNALCEDITFRQIKITDQIFILQGKGGNIGLIKGKDEILIIDDDFNVNAEVLKKTLQDFGDIPKFIVNTHWHGNHTGGNALLGQSSTIIAHTNVCNRLSTPQKIKLFGKKYEAQPETAAISSQSG